MLQVGSDFSGVGAFDQALKRLGIDYTTIFACDMDLHARESYMLNYGEPSYFPFDVYDRKIPKEPLDVYMTSPPCQAFSLAGKRKGEDDKRGVLFYNSHEFIQKNKPRYFIFENVKGLLSDAKGRTFQTWVDMLGGKSVNGSPVIFPREDAVPYHIYHKVLNAKHYGVPQNRERVFIIGIRDDKDNHFNWPKEMPLTKRLKDVLESEVDEKFYLSDKSIEALLVYNNRQLENGNGFSAKFRDIDTVKTMDALKVGGGGKDDLIKVKSATKKGFEVAKEGDSINLSNLSSETRRGRVGKDVAQTLDTACNQAVMMGATKKDNVVVIDHRGHLNKDAKVITNGIIPTLRAESHGHQPKVVIKKDSVEVIKHQRTEEGKQKRLENRIKGKGDTGNFTDREMVAVEQDHSDTILANPNPKKDGLIKDYAIRRLTPRECFRLMDFPDSFKFVCSNTQLYKQAGNSIVVNVLAEIIKKLKLVDI
jgi:DNA (cytosine-5)-methyltransferase 1